MATNYTILTQQQLPVSNRRDTILGVSICFQAISFFAVVLRLFARIKVVRNPGWDDASIIFALGTAIAGTIFLSLSTNHGFGQHITALPPAELKQYLVLFYVSNALYVVATTLIKTSLFLQYLRAFKVPSVKIVCKILFIITILWGATFTFMAWFPCFPINAFWNLEDTTATCYGYGSRSLGPFAMTYEIQGTFDVFLDLAAFLAPLPIFLRQSLSKRERVGFISLFIIGTVVVAVSTVRLATLISHRHLPKGDWTWYSPITDIMSTCEVNLAIIAASIPVFWPVLEEELGKIFVSQEVEVRFDYDRSSNSALEMETGSARSSNDVGSTSDLHRHGSNQKGYKDGFLSFEPQDPGDNKICNETQIETNTHSPHS